MRCLTWYGKIGRGVLVGVRVWVGVVVGVNVGVEVSSGLAVRVGVGVLESVSVGLAVGVSVSVEGGVDEGVLVGSGSVGVQEGSGDEVAVDVKVGEGINKVGVDVGGKITGFSRPMLNTTTKIPSRIAKPAHRDQWVRPRDALGGACPRVGFSLEDAFSKSNKF
jgi:hypothetical protein